jgi:hypothetical protein
VYSYLIHIKENKWQFKERQLDTQRRKENKIILKNILVVFFLPKFVVHQSLKIALERQRKKEHLQTPSPHKALKTAETTRCLQRDLANAERTSVGVTPQATQACNPTSPNQWVQETGT